MTSEHKGLRLEDLSALAYRVSTLGEREPFDALVVSFEGEYGYGCKGNGDGGFMKAIMVLAHELWPARATVLDLRNLDYQWGDWIGAAFVGNPFALVVSDRCRAGLISYVQAEMGKNPSDYLFDSIPEAITRLCRWCPESCGNLG